MARKPRKEVMYFTFCETFHEAKMHNLLEIRSLYKFAVKRFTKKRGEMFSLLAMRFS
jgi:hypothetical protein